MPGDGAAVPLLRTPRFALDKSGPAGTLLVFNGTSIYVSAPASALFIRGVWFLSLLLGALVCCATALVQAGASDACHLPRLDIAFDPA